MFHLSIITMTPLPARKDIKQITNPFMRGPEILAPLLRLSGDWLVWLAALGILMAPTPVWVKILSALVMWTFSTRLFVIGHDACHGSMSQNPKLNQQAGRFAFLPTLTPYAHWDLGHNFAHHGFNNLRSVDFVWQPLDPEQYKALTPFKQWLYRVWRSGWGPGLYYFMDVYWKRMFFPSQKHKEYNRPGMRKDNIQVAAFGLLWIGALIASAVFTGQSVLLLLMLGFVVPHALWLCTMGFLIYVHHTHETIKWYTDRTQWKEESAFLTGTIHIKFPALVSAFLHHIMEHTAHHVDMSVPLNKLKAAQAALEEAFPEHIVVQPFTWKWYFETARACALYDFEKQQWYAFSDI